MRTVWDQDRSVGHKRERDWNIAIVCASSNMVMYKVQQSHGPQQSCRPSSLLKNTRWSLQTCVLPAREALQQQKRCKSRWGKRGGWNLVMVNLEKQPLTVQGKMKICIQCQDFHKLLQLLCQEDSEITTRLEELRGLTVLPGTDTAKPLALLPGEVFILHTSPIPVCIHRCLIHPRACRPHFYGCLRMNLKLRRQVISEHFYLQASTTPPKLLEQ